MPRPPAWVTAEASFPPAAEPIGASRIGCLISSNLVSAVSMVATCFSKRMARFRVHFRVIVHPKSTHLPLGAVFGHIQFKFVAEHVQESASHDALGPLRAGQHGDSKLFRDGRTVLRANP